MITVKIPKIYVTVEGNFWTGYRVDLGADYTFVLKAALKAEINETWTIFKFSVVPLLAVGIDLGFEINFNLNISVEVSLTRTIKGTFSLYADTANHILYLSPHTIDDKSSMSLSGVIDFSLELKPLFDFLGGGVKIEFGLKAGVNITGTIDRFYDIVYDDIDHNCECCMNVKILPYIKATLKGSAVWGIIEKEYNLYDSEKEELFDPWYWHFSKYNYNSDFVWQKGKCNNYSKNYITINVTDKDGKSARNAKVYLDGELVGETSVTGMIIFKSTDGKHTVRAEYDGYYAVSTITVSGEQSVTLKTDKEMSSELFNLKITVVDRAGNPLSGVAVSVDDKEIGETNSLGFITTNINRGEHKVHIQKNDNENLFNINCNGKSLSLKATLAGKDDEPNDESDFEYSENLDGTITITKYIGTRKNVVIPEKIDNKSVTSIAAIS